MSVLTAVLKIVGGILLTLVVLAVMSSGLAQFTEYGNLKTALVQTVLPQLPNLTASEFSEIKSDALAHCSGVETINLADVRSGSPNATIRCADIAAVANGSELKQLAAVGIFDYIYYKNYSCAFIDCLSALPEQERPTVLVSAHANAFFKNAMMWAIAGAVLGLALLVLAIRKPFGIAKAVGIEMLFAGALAYVGLSAAKSMVPAEATQAAGGAVAPLINGLFATLANGFVIVLAVGVVLAIVGFAGSRGAPKKKKK